MQSKAEIANLHHAVLRCQDILEFHVAMDDAILEKKLLSLGNLLGPFDETFKLQASKKKKKTKSLSD